MTKSRLTKIVAGVLIAASITAGGVAIWGFSAISAPGPLFESTTVVIKRGAGLNEIAHQLAAKRVIEHPALFAVTAWVRDAQHKLRAGEYVFEERVSIERTLDILLQGKTVVRRVTVAEGLTTNQVLDILSKAEGLEGEVETEPAEGTLLPNTYHFSLGDTRQAILDRMTEAMKVTVEELWETRSPNLPIQTMEEAVILASIVEKETAIPSERGRVAAVFVNRLRKGMRLESDPTAIYGVTKGSGPLGRRLTRKDLRRDNPYNTYRIKGLPTGPIANPGRDSLAAVMNPIESDEFYFVADGTGGHAFAKTLKEHNRNVAKWRKFRREQKRKQRQRGG